MKRFDRKFGPNFLAEVPASPGVYLFRDANSEVIYVGKAANIRRRLASYRNASRRKVHRKMREIVKAAATVEVRVQANEIEALVVEGELIRELTPHFNTAGKYSFLYPAFGLAEGDGDLRLCFTTDVSAWSEFGFRWFGTFSSRPRAKEAFDALVALLALVGHLEKTAKLEPYPDVVGSRLAGLRRLPKHLSAKLGLFLRGESRELLHAVALALLEKPRARRDAAEVAALLRQLRGFFHSDLAPLRSALAAAGETGTFVAQDERDTLFIRFGPRSDLT